MWWFKQGCSRKSSGSNKNKEHRTKSRLIWKNCYAQSGMHRDAHHTNENKTKHPQFRRKLDLGDKKNSILQKVMIFSLEKAQITKGDYKEKERGDRQALGGDV